MQNRIMISRKRVIGRRVNATPESDIPESVKAAQAAETKAERARRRSRTLSVIGTVFLWLPFLFPVPFFIHNEVGGAPVPLALYPFLVMSVRFSANIGSLLLYLASRAANALRKPVGWLALAIIVLPTAGLILLGKNLYFLDPASITKPVGFLVMLSMALTLLCMLAVNVFSILLLIHIFRRNRKHSAESVPR